MDQSNFHHSCNIVLAPPPIPLDITLRWAGHERTDSPSYWFDGMKRGNLDVVIWQGTISGCGMVKRDGRFHRVPPGSAFLLTIPDRHIYFLPDSSESWEFFYLGFSGKEAMRLAFALQKKYGAVSANFGSPEVISMAQQIFHRSLANDFSDPAEASSLAYRFMMTMMSGNPAGEGRKCNDLLTMVHQYCLEHLSENIGVDDMADFTDLSRSHFCRVFRQQTGKSPYEYLQELRIRTALRMLQSGNLPVKEVAFSCGFAETGYFCKVFRKFFNTTPAAFRKYDSGV